MHVSAHYFYFFSNNQKVFWSNSIFSNFLTYPYDWPPSTLIARSLGDVSGANSQFISTGFMHFGLLGILFYSFLLSIILSYIDRFVSDGIDSAFINTVFICNFTAVFFTSDLFTSLLNHGLALALLMITIFKDQLPKKIDRSCT